MGSVTRGAVGALVLGVLGVGVGTAWAAGSSGSLGSLGSLGGPGPLLPLNHPTSTTTSVVPTTTSTSTSVAPSTTTTTVPQSGDYNPTVGVIPPAAQAEIAAFHPTPPGTTTPLVAALAPLAAYGITPTEAAILGFGRFPVAGKAIWSDDFLSPRFGADGSFRFHDATDIPAACGTPIRSPDDGILTQGSDPGGGTTAEITEADDTFLFLAHLSGYADGTVSGQHVSVGDVIGYVGQTGAATGCHLHLEIHPRGGPAVDPKPFLDAWYADALADAPLVVQEVRALGAPAVGIGATPY